MTYTESPGYSGECNLPIEKGKRGSTWRNQPIENPKQKSVQRNPPIEKRNQSSKKGHCSAEEWKPKPKAGNTRYQVFYRSSHSWLYYFSTNWKQSHENGHINKSKYRDPKRNWGQG